MAPHHGSATGSLGFARDDSAEAEAARLPLFGTWRTAYFVVVGVFVIEVALFYLLSRTFP
ncbi:MAG: hypothetical protein M3372_05915 [Verrucomicrobiota bacterium]|nr:hypothetical protein [Verrucomicrobiota bacterium]